MLLKTHPNLPESNVTSSDCLFWSIICTKPKDIKFIIVLDKENQQILTFEVGTSVAFFFKK